MDWIQWNDELYNVGIEEIDSQHKILVGIINEIYREIDKSQEDESNRLLVLSLLDKLGDYTQYHFSSEEKYFSRLSKNDCELHRLQHKHFIEQISDMVQDFKMGELCLSELLYFLTDWLISHIQIEDKKFIAQFTVVELNAARRTFKD